MKHKWFLLSFMILVACSHHLQRETPEKSDSQITDSKGFLRLSGDFTASQNCVIFLLPSDSEMMAMQNENSEDVYNEMISDITWYPQQASEMLDSAGIKNLMLTNQKKLTFIDKKGNQQTFYKDSIVGDMIIFRCDTSPLFSYAIEFDADHVINFLHKELN